MDNEDIAAALRQANANNEDLRARLLPALDAAGVRYDDPPDRLARWIAEKEAAADRLAQENAAIKRSFPPKLPSDYGYEAWHAALREAVLADRIVSTVARLAQLPNQDARIGWTSTGSPVTLAGLQAGLLAREPWALAFMDDVEAVAIRTVAKVAR